MSTLLGKASLLLHVNLPLNDKMPLLIGFVQIGIDYDGLVANGMSWPPDGGGNVGRKWPILFKRAIFGESIPIGGEPTRFSEDGQTFHVQQTSSGVYNYGFGGYGLGQVGMPEWGQRYWSTQPLGSGATFLWQADSYRRCCTYNSSAGHFLSAYIMGVRDEWNWDAAFDYMDRYMQVETGGWTRQWNSWTANMWDTYRPGFGGYTPIPGSWFPPDF